MLPSPPVCIYFTWHCSLSPPWTPICPVRPPWHVCPARKGSRRCQDPGQSHAGPCVTTRASFRGSEDGPRFLLPLLVLHCSLGRAVVTPPPARVERRCQESAQAHPGNLYERAPVVRRVRWALPTSAQGPPPPSSSCWLLTSAKHSPCPPPSPPPSLQSRGSASLKG